MEAEPIIPEMHYKIREKVDYEQWVFEHLMEMTIVQAKGELKIYENMLNTMIISLSPYWPHDFKEKWDAIRLKSHPDPMNPLNKARLEDKEFLKAELIDRIEIGFTKKKRMKLSKGVLKLWEMFPPFPPSSKP